MIHEWHDSEEVESDHQNIIDHLTQLFNKVQLMLISFNLVAILGQEITESKITRLHKDHIVLSKYFLFLLRNWTTVTLIS